MSQTFSPVLIGSYAALLGGFLPPWRNGVARDIDLCCAPQDLPRFAGDHAVEIAPGKWHCPRPSQRALEVDLTSATDGRLALMNRLCRERVEIGGISVLVSTAQVVWAARAYTVGLNPNQQAKAVRDALWYDSLLLELTDEHRILADLFRRDGLLAAAHHLR